MTVAGNELLLDRLFDQIGFNQIDDDLFRSLILSRLCFPVSKLKTTDYLQKYHGIDVDEDVVYRYLDKLYTHQKQTVQQISYQHTRKVLGEEIRLVFYDVTTLYFEIDGKDELRKTDQIRQTYQSKYQQQRVQQIPETGWRCANQY